MTNQQPSLDLMFQALADPSRRIIVERLCAGPASVSELAQPLAMSLPSVMQHLQLLEGSGLIRSEKVGRVRTCPPGGRTRSAPPRPGSTTAACSWNASSTAWGSICAPRLATKKTDLHTFKRMRP
jgi:DNA-binding transcriptional ArsR family regulator